MLPSAVRYPDDFLTYFTEEILYVLYPRLCSACVVYFPLHLLFDSGRSWELEQSTSSCALPGEIRQRLPGPERNQHFVLLLEQASKLEG